MVAFACILLGVSLVKAPNKTHHPNAPAFVFALSCFFSAALSRDEASFSFFVKVLDLLTLLHLDFAAPACLLIRPLGAPVFSVSCHFTLDCLILNLRRILGRFLVAMPALA